MCMSIGLKRQWTRIARCFLKTEDGGVAIYVALVSAVIIGFGALVVDLGRLFTLQTELQNAADVAALAGAAELDGTSTAITRARAAATTALVTASSPTGILNFQTFASGGAGVTFDPNADIRFLSSLPATDDDPITASHLTTDPRNAFYIEVTARPRQIDYLLAPALAARLGGDGQGPTSGQADAVAVAGFNSVVCKFPPLMICNPAEADVNKIGAGFEVIPGQLIQLKTKGGSGHWGPGNFGLLQPPSGNMGAKQTTEELASSTPSGCFSARVDTRPGAVAPVSNGINVRFDMYDNPYFGGAEKNDSQYKPAPNVIKGKFYKNNKLCTYDDVGNSPCPDGATPPKGRPMPIHACFATPGGCASQGWIHPRFQPPADDNQAAQEIFWADYWASNHPGDSLNALYSAINPDGGVLTRLEMYNWENSANKIPLGDVDGDGTPGEPGAPLGSSGTGGDEGESTATGENGNPMNYGGSEAPDPTRRDMPVAVINCIADGPINGQEIDVPVVAFAKMFLTHVAEGGSNQVIYAEMVGVLQPGIDDEILHDIVQLYR